MNNDGGYEALKALQVKINKQNELDTRIKDDIVFSDKLATQIQILKDQKTCSTMTFKELMVLVNFTYDDMENDTYNLILLKAFKTKVNLNLFDHIDQKVTMLQTNIGESQIPFQEIKYKTVTSERADAYKIVDDPSFGSTKAELVKLLTEFRIYEVRAKYLEDKIIVPFKTIFEQLLTINKTLPYFFEYIVSKVLGLHQLVTVAQLMKLSERTLNKILAFIHYREDPTCKDDIAWNIVLTQKVKTEPIAFFTITDYNGILSNVWVDERFRKQGIADSIFKYVENTILKKHDFIFVTTKHSSMKNLIKKNNWQYVGKCYPYINPGKIDKNEHIYVILNKEKYPDNKLPIEVVGAVYNWGSQPEISSELFNSYKDQFTNEMDPEKELKDMSTIDVYNQWKEPYSNKIRILGTTHDMKAIPHYKDPFDKDHKIYTHLIVEDLVTLDVWYYPLNGLVGDKFQIALHEKFAERATLFNLKVTQSEIYIEGEKIQNKIIVKRNRNGMATVFNYEVFPDEIQVESNGTKMLFDNLAAFVTSEWFKRFKYGVDLNPYTKDGFSPKTINENGSVLLTSKDDKNLHQNGSIFDLI